MENQLLNELKTDSFGSDFPQKVREFLSPVLLNNDQLQVSNAKRYSYFMVKFLRESHEILDKTSEKGVLIRASLIACEGLKCLDFGYFEDQVTMGKILHFILIKVLNYAEFSKELFQICDVLLDLLVQMNRNDNLPDTKLNTPLATNSCLHLGNAFVRRQKEGKRKSDYSFLQYALRFHSLVESGNSVFDKFSSAVRRDLHSCEDMQIVEGILDLGLGLLESLAGVSKSESESTNSIAALTACFALNYQMSGKLSEVLVLVEKCTKSAETLKLLKWFKSDQKNKPVLGATCETETEMFCRTELLFSLKNQTSKFRNELEMMFIENAKIEFEFLMKSDKKDKRANERKARYSLIASNICSTYKTRLSKTLSAEKAPKFENTKTEIDAFKSFVTECVGNVQSSYFLKRLQELAYSVLKFAQGLKDADLTMAIRYFEKSVEILEIWVEKSQKSKSELWTVYHELSWMYLNDKRGEEALTLLEEVAKETGKNSMEIAAMYIKCKKNLNLLTEKRSLTSKMKEKDAHFVQVAKCEFQALKKCKIALVEGNQRAILEKLLNLVKEPKEHGILLLEKAILLWSKSEFDTALENVNEALSVFENSGGCTDDEMVLARANVWKYVLEKAVLQGKYKIFRKEAESDYKTEPNDFTDNQENEQNTLKFRDSFMLIDEHKLEQILVKSFETFENVGAISNEVVLDVQMLQGVFALNGKAEFSVRAAKLLKNDSGRIAEAQALYDSRQNEKALEVLTSCKDQTSVEVGLLQSEILLTMGRVKEGYAILEPMCRDCMKFSTRILGHFMGVMAEYQRLPLAVLGVQVNLDKENRNPLYLSTLSLQCFEQSFCKATDLEIDSFGNWSDKANLKNSTSTSMASQFQILNEYLEALVNGSRRYAEVGESKHAKSYLHDALAHSLRFCLPKWTARVLIESANLSLMEGKVLECEEKLRRAHLILNFEFMEIPQPEKEVETKPEPEAEVAKEQPKDRASDLLSRFGFDTDDDVITSKTLKTEKTIAEQQAKSLAASEPVVLLPANHHGRCQTCNESCILELDFSLAHLNLEILVSQSDCFVRGGCERGAGAIDQSLSSLQSEYGKRFSNPSIFKDIVCKQKLHLAKSDAKKMLPICEQLSHDLSLTSHQDMVRCFQILAEAYYLLGSQTLDQHFVEPSLIGQEDEKTKMTLEEKLNSDDENDEFQNQLHQQAKDTKALNEKPLKKNGRKKRVSEPEIGSPDVIEIKPILSVLGGNDVMMTPESRVSNVNVVRKARGRPRRNLNMDADESSPALVHATDAPRRGRKVGFERKVLNSYSSTELLKPKPKMEVESPECITIDTPGESPGSVASEDLNELLDAMTLEESPEPKPAATKAPSKVKGKKAKEEESGIVEVTKKPARTTSKSKIPLQPVAKVSEPKPAETKSKAKPRAKKVALSGDAAKPAAPRRTRAARTRATENLRTGVEGDSQRPDNENLIGEFRPDVSFPSPAFRDFDLTSSDFPEIETLRGPTQSGRTKRKVLSEMSPSPNVCLSDPSKSARAENERIIKQSSFTISSDDLSRNFLEKCYDLLRHHPVTSLYRKVCLALGLMTSQTDSWTSAFYFNEASCVAYRHEAMLAIQKKRTSRKQAKIVNETEEYDARIEESVSFPKDVEHFKQMIQSLPADWTIVQLSTMTSSESTNHMIATRLRANQTPLVLQCPGYAAVGDSLLESFEETIIDSRMRNSNCEDRIRWWTAKRMFSKNVQHTIENLENQVFGCWKGLLLGCYGNSDTVTMVTKKAKEMLSKLKPKFSKRVVQLLELVLDSQSYLNENQLQAAISEIFGDDCQQAKILTQLQTFKTMYPMSGTRDPLVLILDKNLTNLPLENMPIIETKPVVRSLSVYALYCQHLMSVIDQHRKLTVLGPEMTNVSYILDPDHNLPHTRDNFQSWFSELGWLGTVGKCPSRQEFEANLTNTDMMLYLGHGSGQRYFDRTRIQKLQCRAAVVLMGCSSAALKTEGSMEPRGMVLSYLLARSPFIMGNLWDVTDGDIDRFTKALLEYWLSAEPGTKLYSAMQHAREACRLRYLTGSAPVMYGLPL